MAHLPTLLAYLDPGVGAMLLQAAVAGILGGLLTIKLWWAKFLGFFKKKPASDDVLPPPSVPSETPPSPVEERKL